MIHVLDMKHPLCVLMKNEFDDIVSNNVTVRDFVPLMIDFSLKKVRQTFFKVSRDDIGVNIAPHLKILNHDNLVCLSAVKWIFLSITTEIDSTLRNDNIICLLGDRVPNSSNMMLLFLATYNKDVPKKYNLKNHASYSARIDLTLTVMAQVETVLVLLENLMVLVLYPNIDKTTLD